MLIAAIVGNNIYLTQSGEAEAYLIRRRFCSVISDDLGDQNSKDVFTNIANGTLEPDDFVLLSSTRLLRYISKTDFSRIGSSRSLVAALGELRDFLSAEVLGKMGFVGIHAGLPAELNDQEKGKAMAFLKKLFAQRIKNQFANVLGLPRVVLDFKIDEDFSAMLTAFAKIIRVVFYKAVFIPAHE